MPTSGTRVTTSRPSSEAAPASTRTASPTRRSPWPTCSPAPQPRPTGPVGAEMDWAGWALFGVLAATALTAVIIAAQVAGFFIHLVVAMGLALGHAAMFDPVHCATWWFGALLGLLHVAVALMVLLPLLPGVHPRMGSHRAGPARPGRFRDECQNQYFL